MHQKIKKKGTRVGVGLCMCIYKCALIRFDQTFTKHNCRIHIPIFVVCRHLWLNEYVATLFWLSTSTDYQDLALPLAFLHVACFSPSICIQSIPLQIVRQHICMHDAWPIDHNVFPTLPLKIHIHHIILMLQNNPM